MFSVLCDDKLSLSYLNQCCGLLERLSRGIYVITILVLLGMTFMCLDKRVSVTPNSNFGLTLAASYIVL